MADIKKQAAKLLAEEIAQAITKRAGGNAVNASSALVARSAQSLSGNINASQIVGSLNSSQISDLNGAIAGVLIGIKDSTNPDDVQIVGVISDLAALEVDNLFVDTAQIEKLYASYGEFIRLVAEEGNFDEVYADLAKITNAEIADAKISHAQIVKLDAETGFIREGNLGEIYIDDLVVTDAQILNLNVGNLVIQDPATKKLHNVYIDSSSGTPELILSTEPIVDGSDIVNESITNALIKNGEITASKLNVDDIFANNANIMTLIASNIDTTTLTSSEAFIAALATNTIGNYTGDPNAVQTAIINLTNNRIEFTVGKEVGDGVDENGDPVTKLVLTKKMLRAIADKIHLEANNIDLSANETVKISASQINDFHIGPLAPQEPIDNMLWLDTDASPNVWKRYEPVFDEDGNQLEGKWVIVNEQDIGEIAKAVYEAEVIVDGETGTVSSIASKISANEEGLTEVSTAIEAITPEYIFNTVVGNDGFSESVQDQDGFMYATYSPDGKQISSFGLTKNAVKVISDEIDIKASKLNAVISEVVLEGDEFKTAFEQLTIDGSNINLSADQIQAVIDDVQLSGKNLTLTEEQIDVIADQVEISGDKIYLNANEEFRILVGRVDKVEDAPPQVFRQDDPPSSDVAKVNSLWVCTANSANGMYKDGLTYQAVLAETAGVTFAVDSNGLLTYTLEDDSSISDGQLYIGDDGHLYLNNSEVALWIDDNGQVVEGFAWVLVQDAELLKKINDTEAALNEKLENLEGKNKNLIDEMSSTLKNQIDGKIETHFNEADPTPENEPASNWDENEKLSHAGDIYFNTTSNAGWTWTGTDWKPLSNKDTIKALEDLKNVETALDGKMNVFADTPKPPYQKGDLWAPDSDVDGDGNYDGKIYVCINGRENGDFVESDWTIASNYTNEETVQNLISTATQDLQEQIDGKINVWYIEEAPKFYYPNMLSAETSKDPAYDWILGLTNQSDIYNILGAHVGDLYYDTLNNYSYRFGFVDGIGYTWVKITDSDSTKAIEAAKQLEATLDTKVTIFTCKDLPTPPYTLGDLWTKGTDNDLMVCVVAKESGDGTESDWEVASAETLIKVGEELTAVKNEVDNVKKEQKKFFDYDYNTQKFRIGNLEKEDRYLLMDEAGVSVSVNGNEASKFASSYIQFGNYQIRYSSSDGGLVFNVKEDN